MLGKRHTSSYAQSVASTTEASLNVNTETAASSKSIGLYVVTPLPNGIKMIIWTVTLVLSLVGAPWGMWCRQSGKSISFMLSIYMLAWLTWLVTLVLVVSRIFR